MKAKAIIESTTLTRERIATAVTQMLDVYIKHGPAKSAYDIGSGECEQFAYDVIEQLGQTEEVEAVEFAQLTGKLGCPECDEVFYPETLRKFKVKLPQGVTVEQLNASGLGTIGTHVFLRWNFPVGFVYFDAECPQGTDSPFSLPFAKRYLSRA